jgi:HPr Serine kinase C-terminal domain
VYNYNAYDLGICSALPLPELQPAAEVAADVMILLGRVDWSPSPGGIQREEEMRFEITSDEAFFSWPQLGKFRVRDGKEIVIDPNQGVEERMLRLPLLGTILAVLLHQRGHLVLHASAVAIDGEAVVFVGNKGRGKSTMAATLYRRGHELIADDVVALAFENGRPIVVPGYPQFKLYPEAVAASLGDDHKYLPELAEGYEKLGRRIGDRFARQPLPLNSIYVLGLGPIATITSIDPQTALLGLIRNSYMARFGKQLLTGVEASSHLRQCTRLVRQVPVLRLERPNSLALLPSVARLVEEHVQQNSVLV